MVLIPHPNHPEKGYYMEQELHSNLKILPTRIEKDKDVLGIFVGNPGEGKSTLAQQVAYFLDNKFNTDMITWNYEDFITKGLGLFTEGKSKGRAVMHDEGREVLSALSVLSKRTRKFMSYLYENRQTNMYQFILTGDLFDLPKSIVMQRALFCIYVHEEGEFENGFFKFYNRPDLRRLYITGKKSRSMTASGYSFRGKFSKFYTVDEERYRQLKKDNLNPERYIDKKKEDVLGDKDFIMGALNRLMFPDQFNVSKFCHEFGITPSYFYQVKKEMAREEIE